MSDTVTIAVNIGGVSRSQRITRVGTVFTDDETPVAGVQGRLTTRTNGTDGTITVTSHSVLATDFVDIGWVDVDGINRCCRRADVGTVTGTTIPFTAGAGDALPAAPYTTGTCTVVNGVVTLAGGATAPANAAYCTFVSGANVSTVASRDSDTQLTLTDTTINVTGGSNYSLSATVVVGVRMSATWAAVGNTVKLISLYSAPPAGQTDSRAMVDFMASGPTSIKACDLASGEPWAWATNSPIANPLAGATVATIEFSSLTTQAPTVYAEIIYNA
jgi:hypothetical protein